MFWILTVNDVIGNLTEQPQAGRFKNRIPGRFFRRDVRGSEPALQRNGWSDGLPIVPPTMEKVQEFLAPTAIRKRASGVCCRTIVRQRSGIFAVWGVMAGCRRIHADPGGVGEAMADPRYGVEHSGNTPGAETLIVLNGPLIKELNFNCERLPCVMVFSRTASAGSGGSICAMSQALLH